MTVSALDLIRVLYVSDIPETAHAESQALAAKDEHIAVTSAQNPQEALDQFASNKFDCIVSAYDMSGMDGIELLERIRDTDQEIPFILFAENGSEQTASDAISQGVTNYIQKDPETNYEELARKITHTVHQHTDHRRVTETDQRLRTLIETTNDILWMFNHDWSELLFINSAYEEIWGRSIETLKQNPRDFLRGIHPDDREGVRSGLAELSEGESVEVEYRVNPEENFQRWVWVQAVPIVDETGEVVRIAGFARDITQRKEHERELERQNERLKEFASIVSHDLRNPLTLAHGHLDLVRNEYESESLDVIESSLDRMDTIIEETLTLARQGQTVGDTQSIDLTELTHECWSALETANATLEVDDGLTIEADSDRLKHIFENLFRNAIDHAGPNVNIRVGRLEGTDGFYVEDDGGGIPTEEWEEIFEAGYTTISNGSGYGLNIVQNVVEAHGWDIRVTEGRRGGACFEITGVTVS